MQISHFASIHQVFLARMTVPKSLWIQGKLQIL